MDNRTETPPPGDRANIYQIVGTPDVPRGMCVMVSPNRRVVWMGPAKELPDNLWEPGSCMNLNSLDYERVKEIAASREKGIPVH